MNIEEAWKYFIKNILDNGEYHVKDDDDMIKEVLINHCFIDNPLLKFSLNIKSDLFIEMIKKGQFDIDDYPIKGEGLAEYVSSIDDEYMRNGGDFVYTYPERIYNICQANKSNEVIYMNQFDVVCDRLKEYYGSNRGVMTLYSSALDFNETHIPCLNWLQVTIRNNQLILHVMFRSNDLYSAFPSNMLFLLYLGIKFCEELKKEYPLLKFKGINYNSTSLHIYKSDMEQAEKVIGAIK